MNNIAISLIVLVGTFSIVYTERTFMKLFERGSPEYSNFSMETSYNEPDLDSYLSLHWSAQTLHWAEFSGGWITYDGVNFTDGWAIGYCLTDCSGFLDDGVKSLRVAGVQSNASRSAFSVFNSTRWMGPQLIFDSDQPNITLPFQSTYTSGGDPWTVYSQPNYSGWSFCLEVNYVSDIVTGLGIAPGDIKSVRKGCLSSNIVSQQDLSHNFKNKPVAASTN